VSPLNPLLKGLPSGLLSKAKKIINFYSQGGAKFPTGGMSLAKSKDKPASARFVEVSRSGEMPEPTVIVRMRENENTLV